MALLRSYYLVGGGLYVGKAGHKRSLLELVVHVLLVYRYDQRLGDYYVVLCHPYRQSSIDARTN